MIVQKRFKRDDWFEIGLRILADLGPDALTIEALCAQADRSKGSFYYHFESIDAYLVFLSQFWCKRDTEEIIHQAESVKLRPIEELSRLTSQLDCRIEQSMRRLALSNNGVLDVVSKVDRQRVVYLEKIYSETGRISNEDAALLASVVYAAFVGFQQIAPDASSKILHEKYLRFMTLLGPTTMR